MNQDFLILYKLIVLYMLDRVDFPLTRTQITEFILEKEYTTYLNLQAAISQLVEGNMITEKTIRNRTLLSLTEEGLSTLSFFSNRISDEIKQEIDAYLQERAYDLKEEVSVTGEYYKSTEGDYKAHLIAKEKGSSLIELTLSLPSEEIAASVCQNWEKKNQEVYQKIIEQLL